jgi:broad specificity phosphatase PhoE
MVRPVLLFLSLLLSPPLILAEEQVWNALAEGGYVVMMRHALAPGTGDPANFQVDDCSTQRNLNDTGREQARQTGAAFRQRQIPISQVYTSQWCRCRETAQLLDLGSVEELSPLNSFFRNRDQRAPQTAALRNVLAELELGDQNAVMVTHFVNISALTGEGVSSGEMVVIEPHADGSISVVGSINAF